MHRLLNSAIRCDFFNSSNKVLTFKNVIECLYCFSFFFRSGHLTTKCNHIC